MGAKEQQKIVLCTYGSIPEKGKYKTRLEGITSYLPNWECWYEKNKEMRTLESHLRKK